MMGIRSVLRKIKHDIRSRFLPISSVRQMNGGYKIELHPQSDSFERRMYEDRQYEPATLSLFEAVLSSGDTVVDVGANLGIMSLHASKCVGTEGRVIAVEAHPIYFKRLEDNLTRNSAKNVIAVNAAAGARDEQRQIFDFPNVNIGRSSLVDAGGSGKPAGITRVGRLDDILRSAGAGNVRLLKMDVEGFEAEVLKGAPDLLMSTPVICMEVVSEQPVEGKGDPLCAHDMIMNTGLYDCYKFAGSKFRTSALVRILSRTELIDMHDNVIYISPTVKESLPISIFN